MAWEGEAEYRGQTDRGWMITDVGDLQIGLIMAFFLLLRIFKIFHNKIKKLNMINIFKKSSYKNKYNVFALKQHYSQLFLCLMKRSEYW